jgi:hypothetical protein
MVVGLTYTKDLYANVIEWYKDVHARAQLILTLDGAFVTLLSGAVVTKRVDLEAAAEAFGPETWIFLALMAVAFAASGACVILALMPRGLRWTNIRNKYRDFMQEDQEAGRKPPTSVMWWHQFIKEMGRIDFMRNAAKVGDQEERNALASQIVALSERLRWKYRLVYAGFIATAVAVLSLLLATTFYVVRVGF